MKVVCKKWLVSKSFSQFTPFRTNKKRLMKKKLASYADEKEIRSASLFHFFNSSACQQGKMEVIIQQEETSKLLKFLADLPTNTYWQRPKTIFDLWIFWSSTEEQKATSDPRNPSTSSNHGAIVDHIKAALHFFHGDRFHDVLIQYWAPTVAGGQRFLTTAHQPFALTHLNEKLTRFRKHSLGHRFSVSDVANGEEGLPGRVFRNQLPEFSQDISYYTVEQYPHRDLAVSSGIVGSLGFPVFEPSQGSCVGVLELVFPSDLLQLLNIFIWRVNSALEVAGLETINTEHICKQVQEGVHHVQEEIMEVLQIACQTHGLVLACAWFRYGNSSNESDKDSNGSGRGELVVPIPDLFAHNGCISPDYLFASRSLPLRVGRGLVGNAFLSNKPLLCREVTQLGTSEYPMAHSTRKFGLTGCFAVCLQSIDNGSRDYVLEFHLSPATTYKGDLHSLLSSLLAMMKHLFKEFVVVVGDREDELYIEVNKDSFVTVFESLKTRPPVATHIALQNKGQVMQEQLLGHESVTEELVEKSKAHNQNKESSCSYETLRQHFGMKLEDVSKSLGVSRSTIKRWCREHKIDRWPSSKRSKVRSLTTIPNEQNETFQGEVEQISENKGKDLAPMRPMDTMMVKGTYKNATIKFKLSFSSRVADLMAEVNKRLKLSEGTFCIKYQDDDGGYVLISCDEDLHDCMDSFRSNEGNTIILSIEPPVI